MGLFGFLRRKDESAMPDPDSAEFQQAVAGSALPGSEGLEMGSPGWSSVGDAASAEEMGKRVAAQLGMDPATVRVAQGASPTMDLRGTDAREQILETLRARGIDPDRPGQQIDASTVPGLTEAIMEILGRHGVTIPQAGTQIPAAGGLGGYVGTSSPSAADPIAQVEHLAKQREAGEITEAEFEAQKKRILGE